MEKNQTERAYEEKRLKKTIFLAGGAIKTSRTSSRKKESRNF